MKEMIAVFGNRTQALTYERMIRRDIRCQVIPTPREVGASCSLSVLMRLADYPKALYYLKKGRFSSFRAFYEIREGYGKKYFVYPNRF